MSRHKEAPIEDDFMTWFRSLTTEKKREALQGILNTYEASCCVVVASELLANLPLYSSSGGDTVIFLN